MRNETSVNQAGRGGARRAERIPYGADSETSAAGGRRRSSSRPVFQRLHKPILALFMTALVSACAVGPDYRTPEAAEPGYFTRATAMHYDLSEPPARFWRGLEDPLLTALVENTLAANQDIAAALARYERSRALLGETRLDRFPTVTAQGRAADTRASADELPGVSRAGRDQESYDIGIRAAWELDFFGRVRRGVQAGRAEMQADGADLAAVRVAVVGEVAQAYFQLRGLQQQLRVARGNAAAQRDTLEVIEARLDAGRGTDFDMARARNQLESTRARIPELEGEIAVTKHRIAVLTGREPGALVEVLAEPAAPPALPARVPVGTPGELLRRRPDIIAAERRLAAATARIGVNTADLFPRFTLGGLVGRQAADTGDLSGRDAETGFVALGIDWSFLDIGRVRARIAAAEAGADANLAEYRHTVLRALEEVENAMVRYARIREAEARYRRAAEAGTEAARLARLRFDGGAVDFLHVLDAERARLESEDRLATAQTRAGIALVALYRSLAGGWGSSDEHNIAACAGKGCEGGDRY